MIKYILRGIFIFFLCTFVLGSTDSASPPSDAYNAAVKAYTKYHNKSRYLVVVDFDLPSTSKRLWVIDMKTHRVVYNTWVTHGSGSGGLYADRFSNQPGSLKSSLGAYITGKTYYGKHGLSRRIHGLESTNNNAYARSIVIHGANYIGNGRTGRSWGCFAVPQNEVERLIRLVREGTILYAYHA